MFKFLVILSILVCLPLKICMAFTTEEESQIKMALQYSTYNITPKEAITVLMQYGYLKEAANLLKNDIRNRGGFNLELNRLLVDVYLHDHKYQEVFNEEKKIIVYFKDHRNIANYEDEVLTEKVKAAFIYNAAGYPKQSAQTGENIFQDVQSRYGMQDERTMNLMKTLAQAYHSIGREEESIKLYHELYNLNQNLYGQNSRQAMLSLNDLAGARLGAEGTQNKDKIFYTLTEYTKSMPEDTERDKLDKLKIQYNIANYYNESGKYDFCLNYFIKTLLVEYDNIFDKYKTVHGSTPFGETATQQVRLLGSIAKCYENMGNDADSLTYNLKAFDLANKVYGKDHQETLYIMTGLANNYVNLIRYDEALNMATEVLERSNKLSGEMGITTLDSKYCLARAYAMSGNINKAREIDEEGFALIRQAPLYNPSTKIRFLDNLVYDYLSLKETTLALDCQKALLNAIKNYFGEDHPHTLHEMVTLADIYNKIGGSDNYKTAIELSSKALNLESQILTEDDAELLYSTSVLARAYRLNNQNEESAKYYKTLIDGYENMRDKYSDLSSDVKSKWFATKIDSYKEAAHVFSKTGMLSEAFQTTELCKARDLAEKYSDQLITSDTMFDFDEQQKFKTYHEMIVKGKILIKSAVKEKDLKNKLIFENDQSILMEKYRNFREDLQKKYPAYQRIQDMQKVDVNKDKDLLSTGTSYISFTINSGDNEVLVFVANAGKQVEGTIIAIDEKFLNQCQLYHDLLAYPNVEAMRMDNKYLWKLSDGSHVITNGRKSPAEGATNASNSNVFRTLQRELSTSLGEKLLKPLEMYLGDNWVISPDSELSSIPFETLQYNGKSAIESANISYVPSLTVLKIMKEQSVKNAATSNRKDLFAMGNAIYGDTEIAETRGSMVDFSNTLRGSKEGVINLRDIKWNDLPGTGKEIEQVSGLFDENKKSVLIGQNASEGNLKSLDRSRNLSEYRYLLFATHGLFVPEKPELSSIVLSQGLNEGNNDGYITVAEWMGYHLGSDLVYLSACESGLGGYKAGEGIIGIPYALTVAGNKDTVMSLWKVNDEATAEFSSIFFKKLSEGKSEVQALNETKREFLANPNAKFNSPSVWAAFLLYGV